MAAQVQSEKQTYRESKYCRSGVGPERNIAMMNRRSNVKNTSTRKRL